MIIAALLISSTLVIVVEFFYIQKLKTVNHYINSDLEKLSNENVYLAEENENLKISLPTLQLQIIKRFLIWQRSLLKNIKMPQNMNSN